MNKALELRNRASELGDAESYNNLGSAYFSGGDGLQVDIDELSAMKGVMYQEDTGWAWHSKNHWKQSRNYTWMDMQQKMIMQKLWEYTKHTYRLS